MAENKDIIKLSSFKKTIIVVDEIQENGNYQPEICQNAYDPNKVSMYVDQQKNETLMSNYYTIEEIEEILSGKTNIDSVYTKDETYNKDEVYNVSQIDFLLKLKVNKVDVYSKIDMNTLLSLKANKNEIYDKNKIDEILGSYYTKIEIDTILENKADKADVIAISGQVLTNIEDIEYLEENKQDKLIAGDNITISGNVISADLNDYLTIVDATDTYETIENVNSLSDIVSGHTRDISNKADKATMLSGYNITDAYTKTEIDNKISAVFRYKGSVSTLVELNALTGMVVGDVYNVTATGDNYAWTGTLWDKLSGEIDLSAYLKTEDAATIYETIENVQILSNTVSGQTGYISDLETNKADKADVIAISGQVLTNIEDISDLKTNKQDNLTAGENIVISDNVISADLNDYLTIDGAINTYETIENVQTLSDVVSGHTGDIESLEANKADTSHTHTKSEVGLSNVDNTSDLTKPISTATQTALNNKANTSHTHIKSEVGLANVDNTSDSAKPVSTATQTALNSKADKADTLSGYGITDAYTKTEIDINSENYKTYSGFENRADSTISIDETTGVFTLAPTTTSFNVWTNGTGKHIITTTQTVTITDDQTITYIYIDSNGTLQKSITAWNIKNGENAPCSIIFKDGTHYTITNERHSYDRNREWHNWAHNNIGTMYHHGLVGTFTNNTLSITQGVIADEDITFDTLNTKTKASLWYRNGASGMRMVRNSSTPYSLNGTTIQYDNGSGTLQPVGNNKYTCSWVYCSNDSEEPIYVVIGQNQYNTQTLALNASGPIINLSTAEWKLLYKVIYQNKSGVATYVQTVDYRTVQTGVATTPVTPTSHANLTERDAANSHPATAISVTTPSGYTSTDVDGLSKEIIANLNNASGRYYAETVSAPANAGTLTLKNATETVISTTLTNSNSFAIALPTAISDGKINESILIFKVGATLPTLTQPSGVVYRTETPAIAINQTWTFCYERVTYDNGLTFEIYVSATKNV